MGSADRQVILKAIASFSCAETEGVFYTGKSRRFRNFQVVALRKLRMINAALDLNDLRQPPGNRLEALSGNRKGQYSIRINKQWRICFQWKESRAHNVKIEDYHK